MRDLREMLEKQVERPVSTKPGRHEHGADVLRVDDLCRLYIVSNGERHEFVDTDFLRRLGHAHPQPPPFHLVE